MMMQSRQSLMVLCSFFCGALGSPLYGFFQEFQTTPKMETMEPGRYTTSKKIFPGPIEIKYRGDYAEYFIIGIKRDGCKDKDHASHSNYSSDEMTTADHTWSGPEELQVNYDKLRFRFTGNQKYNVMNCPVPYSIEIVAYYDETLPNPYFLRIREEYPDGVTHNSSDGCKTSQAYWHYHDVSYTPRADDYQMQVNSQKRFFRSLFNKNVQTPVGGLNAEQWRVFAAAVEGNTDIIKAQLKSGISPNLRDPNYPSRTPFSIALRLEEIPAAQELGNGKNFVLSKDDLAWLTTAGGRSKGRWEQWKLVAELSKDPKVADQALSYALADVGDVGSEEILKFLKNHNPSKETLKKGFDTILRGPLVKNILPTDYNPLLERMLKEADENALSLFTYLAAANNSESQLQLVLPYHPKLDPLVGKENAEIKSIKWGYRLNPLGIAIMKGHTSIALALLTAGADPNVKITEQVIGTQKINEMPLVVWAARYINFHTMEVIEALAGKGASVVTSTDSDGYTTLDMVISALKSNSNKYDPSSKLDSPLVTYTLNAYLKLVEMNAHHAKVDSPPQGFLNGSSK